MPSARIWRCVRQNFAGSAASSALPPRVLQEGVKYLNGRYARAVSVECCVGIPVSLQ